jgi:hypothetical protein
MNIQEIPTIFREDIEDASLAILSQINDRLILIGGWAVRAHLGDGHGRFTLDVDGVARPRHRGGDRHPRACWYPTSYRGIVALTRLPWPVSMMMSRGDIRYPTSEVAAHEDRSV